MNLVLSSAAGLPKGFVKPLLHLNKAAEGDTLYPPNKG